MQFGLLAHLAAPKNEPTPTQLSDKLETRRQKMAKILIPLRIMSIAGWLFALVFFVIDPFRPHPEIPPQAEVIVLAWRFLGVVGGLFYCTMQAACQGFFLRHADQSKLWPGERVLARNWDFILIWWLGFIVAIAALVLLGILLHHYN